VYGDLTEPVQREALFEKASDDQWQRGVHRHDQANAAGESNEKTGASRHLADFLRQPHCIMIKARQKISGTFRPWQGVQSFCRTRGYLSTAKKPGMNVL
jgi:hypothetical protein